MESKPTFEDRVAYCIDAHIPTRYSCPVGKQPSAKLRKADDLNNRERLIRMRLPDKGRYRLRDGLRLRLGIELERPPDLIESFQCVLLIAHLAINESLEICHDPLDIAVDQRERVFGIRCIRR